MIVTIPMYRVVCDGEDCTKSAQDDGDYFAWAQEEGATEEALGSDWTFTDDGEHFCPDCTPLDDE